MFLVPRHPSRVNFDNLQATLNKLLKRRRCSFAPSSLATCQMNSGRKEHSMLDNFSGTVFSPWAKPRGMHQAMARYQALKGLKPVGPHRALADNLLGNISERCSTCNGTGLHGTYGGLGWRVCPVCHGLGETYSITLDELQGLRQQVLDLYPDAAPFGWTPGHPISCPIQSLTTGAMIDACPRRNIEPMQRELIPGNAGESGVAFLPWSKCILEEPSLRSIPRPPARARLSWEGLWVLVKVLWGKLSA